MKTYVLCATLVLTLGLGGCATEQASTSPSSGTASPTSTPTVTAKPAVSLSESCLALMGDELDGPMYQARAFLADPEMTVHNPNFFRQGIEHYEVQKEIFDIAPASVSEYSEPLLKAFEDIVDLNESGTGTWTFVATPYTEALNAVTTICVKAGTPVGDLSELDNEADVTSNESGISSATEISGKFEDDLAQVGVFPDSIGEYASLMKGLLCTSPVGPGAGSMEAHVAALGGGSPQAGQGAEALKLTVAYFCPLRFDAVVNSLRKNGYS